MQSSYYKYIEPKHTCPFMASRVLQPAHAYLGVLAIKRETCTVPCRIANWHIPGELPTLKSVANTHSIQRLWRAARLPQTPETALLPRLGTLWICFSFFCGEGTVQFSSLFNIVWQINKYFLSGSWFLQGADGTRLSVFYFSPISQIFAG